MSEFCSGDVFADENKYIYMYKIDVKVKPYEVNAAFESKD